MLTERCRGTYGLQLAAWMLLQRAPADIPIQGGPHRGVPLLEVLAAVPAEAGASRNVCRGARGPRCIVRLASQGHADIS